MSLNLAKLRKRHPAIHYRNYTYSLSGDKLTIEFEFLLEPDIKFTPRTSISFPNTVASLPKHFLDNAVFHLGLIELISYYKSACPPAIYIHPHKLPASALTFWQSLYLNGLSEFIFLNQLSPSVVNDINFQFPASAKPLPKPHSPYTPTPNSLLIPLGGGKDSAVTVSLLHPAYPNITPFLVNPLTPSLELIKHHKLHPPVIVTREIDPQLLKLNKAGYLNGHTPFSAYLSFASLPAGALTGSDHLVFSNEQSANYEMTKLNNLPINHQYSKSYHFESAFRKYTDTYLIKHLNYFSFLRPLYDLQIAKIFTSLTDQLLIANSCNRYPHTHTWCGHCSKCLFVYLAYSAFLPSQSVEKIFGHNLLNDQKLLPIYQQMIDPEKTNPLDCVGTKKESIVASALATKQHKPYSLPLLLKYFTSLHSHADTNQKLTDETMSSWSDENHLPAEFAHILKQSYEKISS